MTSGSGLVIFDCDGVLVDSETISMRELTRAINALGVAMTETEAHAAYGGATLAQIERDVELRNGGPVRGGWIDEFYTVRAEAFARELDAVDGARETVLEVQRRGWATCIASQARVIKMEQTLALAGLDDLFPPERIFSATMVERPKPAPDLFLHAARSCGWEPADCVVVEDSAGGVRGARAAGMRALGYVAPDRPADAAIALDAAGAEIVRDMREVPERVSA
ncbi:HAD family phosphatase [Conexibacter sp. CPCC 206217]|uniref:HAD family hydrolase n=1 Tax=Conexibacter sp. CPCC 206217 TaxID=3064574 RepID=UPI002723ADBC|nr:HAD-IA family hydrolase [Conexibacter sp. CPCC 206217]MDO8210673.1 HAD-IA family hydrolase [Conexibacter sp. CPCC 206217]